MFNQNERCYRVATKECQLPEREKIMSELSIANNMMAFYKTVDGEHKALFTDTTEEEFFMLCNILNNNPKVLNLFKLVLMDVENYKQAPLHDDKFTYKAIEYIRMAKLYQPLKMKKHEQF